MSKTIKKELSKEEVEDQGGRFYGADIPYERRLDFKGRKYTLIWFGRLDFKPEEEETKELGIDLILVKQEVSGEEWAGLYSAL